MGCGWLLIPLAAPPLISAPHPPQLRSRRRDALSGAPSFTWTSPGSILEAAVQRTSRYDVTSDTCEVSDVTGSLLWCWSESPADDVMISFRSSHPPERQTSRLPPTWTAARALPEELPASVPPVPGRGTTPPLAPPLDELFRGGCSVTN